MKFITRAAAIYLVFGFLTFLHWEVVWLADTPFTDFWSSPFGRGPVTLFFGPLVFFSWPAYWACMLPFGGDWFAFHPPPAILIGIIAVFALAGVLDDIIDDIRRLGRAL